MNAERPPLTANERHHAIRRIERASNIVRHGSFITIPFLPFVGCCPLGPVMIIWLAVPIFFFKFIHSYFAEAADDIANRQPRPLFIALTIAALLMTGTLFATALIAEKIAHTDGGADRWLLMLLPLGLLGFCGWMLKSFIEAWNALSVLRSGRAKGFEVIVAPTADQTTQSGPSAESQESKPTLPPRPKLGPRKFDRP
jgi:hypothetical protein